MQHIHPLGDIRAECLGNWQDRACLCPSHKINFNIGSSFSGVQFTSVCVNSTSGGERSLATPAYQGRLALVLLPLGAAVNKIKGATLTPPSA
jgi:hypothetical protein